MKKVLKYLLMLLLGLLLVLAGYYIYLWYLTRTSGITKKQLSTELAATQLVYIRDGHVYTNKIEGGAETKVTQTEPFEVNSRTMAKWVNTDAISYIDCQVTCDLRSHDIDTHTEQKVITGMGRVHDYDWNSDGSKVVYVAESYAPDFYQVIVYDRVNDVKKELVKRALTPYGRGGATDDNVAVYFSPDEDLVLFNQTIFPDAIPRIEVLNASTGAQLLAVSDTWATFANWIGDEELVYKSNGKIYKRDINANSPTTLTTGNWYGITASLDMKILSYFEVTDGKGTILYTYDLDADNFKKIAEQRIDPFFMGNDLLVALDLKKCVSEDECIFDLYGGYTLTATTTRYNLDDGTEAAYYLKNTRADVLYEEVTI